MIGFERLSRLAGICAPWIFIVFVAGAIASLRELGVASDLSNLGEVARTRIWNGVPSPGQERFTFWHITFFAWFCNMAMHIGMSDLTIFRFARKSHF